MNELNKQLYSIVGSINIEGNIRCYILPVMIQQSRVRCSNRMINAILVVVLIIIDIIIRIPVPVTGSKLWRDQNGEVRFTPRLRKTLTYLLTEHIRRTFAWFVYYTRMRLALT